MTPTPPSTEHMNRSFEEESTGAHDALSEILPSFKDADARNFLFTREPIEKPYFNMPNFSKTAVTASMSSKRCYEQVIEYAQGYIVYVPAFNISNRNLGFGYHYQYGNDSNIHSSTRFVHDDSNGTFTTVIQTGEMVIIMYKKYDSMSCHKRITACFEQEGFLSIVRSATVEELCGILRELVVGVEFRDCPHCGGCECSCDITRVRAKHPFDSSGFKEGVRMLMGSFRGFARVERHDRGMVTTQNVGCTIDVTETNDEGIIEKLRLWGGGGDDGDGDGVCAREDVWDRDPDGRLMLNEMREGRGENVVDELKVALRRERNRASARKSNLKKKIVNDGLKAAVLEQRQCLEKLRRRELVLRRRNLELRRLLALQEGGTSSASAAASATSIC